MFLINNSIHCHRYFWLVFFLIIDPAKSAQSLPSCYVELPVYDAIGDKHAYEIITVTPEGERALDLLTTRQTKDRVVAQRERLHFPRDFIGRAQLEITLKDKQSGRTTRTRLALMSCEQRASLED